jgi:glyoxylase-like metal-dependent hydrolase (beta-lactamase superfamily II)
VHEIAMGIWRWERRPRGLRPGEFGARTSYAVAVSGETLLVDPLVDGDDDPALQALDDLVRGRVRILVTMPFHTRSAEALWRRYRRAKAHIYGHPDVATRLGDASGFERRRRWWQERYLPTVERLAALDVEHVLVTHGHPVVGHGAAALRRAIERDPWQRPKR